MTEYEQLGHMEEVKTRVAMPQFFLPHHAIHRSDSSTTKTRVVFDGSSKSGSHLSLNDLLLTGPTVQPPLLSIILNFRLHQYVITADIEKMYRQIMVHIDDRPLQQILWRKQESDPIKTYRLNTLTYGTSCAPFLATRKLIQLADDEGADFPMAAASVKKNFYVDDLLVGADSIDSLTKTCEQVDGLLNRAGFSLRKWSANHPSLSRHIPEDRRETQTELELDRAHSIKALGLLWFPVEDELGFKVPEFPLLTKVTKRTALSEMSRLFDPLGLIGPIIAKAKMFVQQLWKENLQWDDELPEQLITWWLAYRAKLNNIRKLRVPRWILGRNSSKYELHCFVDASEKGYGSCIYIVSQANSIKTSRLLIAKSRVAPTIGLSIPRLELCAAVLGSQLADTVVQTTDFSGNIIYWTDSTIVINWILSPSTSWKTFGSNRVAEVQRLTKGSPTALNPADRISRGTDPDQLQDDTLWWNGPPFLLLTPALWPEFIPTLSPVALELSNKEQRQIVAVLACKEEDPLVTKFSQLACLLRVTAYCLRFVRNCRSSCNRTYGYLTPIEYDNALKVLIRHVQNVTFQAEIEYLRNRGNGQNTLKDASFKSSLKGLDLMLDDQGLLRMNGRLAKSTASFDSHFITVGELSSTQHYIPEFMKPDTLREQQTVVMFQSYNELPRATTIV
ncbi:uncharacterized protein LOC129766528 [Toxorhynchites rutilus septentrionalis]|uniref:uncharacterized protein LOC129766528 n=1 Tax=Toxorhynchites rutilus septentrionalis TaxID=329112 RepID=UPI0024796A8B|nr:uncharacterized protein LOC129766528 [Toxorhynchites rutilus septentrionalis]